MLAAMGVPAEVAMGTVRLSLGRHTTEDAVARASALLGAAVESLRRDAGTHRVKEAVCIASAFTAAAGRA